MTTLTTWPRSQHWTVDGWRITVLLYKSHRRERCSTCGGSGAIHCVWATPADRSSQIGPMGDFCDAHRPARGMLPDLDYAKEGQ